MHRPDLDTPEDRLRKQPTMSAFVRELIFNTKRPFGPLKAADTCEVGQKHVRFSSSLTTNSIHVDLGHGMQCSALECGRCIRAGARRVATTSLNTSLGIGQG